jgi:hypothetical protein
VYRANGALRMLGQAKKFGPHALTAVPAPFDTAPWPSFSEDPTTYLVGHYGPPHADPLRIAAPPRERGVKRPRDETGGDADAHAIDDDAAAAGPFTQGASTTTLSDDEFARVAHAVRLLPFAAVDAYCSCWRIIAACTAVENHVRMRDVLDAMLRRSSKYKDVAWLHGQMRRVKVAKAPVLAELVREYAVPPEADEAARTQLNRLLWPLERYDRPWLQARAHEAAGTKRRRVEEPAPRGGSGSGVPAAGGGAAQVLGDAADDALMPQAARAEPATLAALTSTPWGTQRVTPDHFQFVDALVHLVLSLLADTSKGGGRFRAIAALFRLEDCERMDGVIHAMCQRAPTYRAQDVNAVTAWLRRQAAQHPSTAAAGSGFGWLLKQARDADPQAVKALDAQHPLGKLMYQVLETTLLEQLAKRDEGRLDVKLLGDAFHLPLDTVRQAITSYATVVLHAPMGSAKTHTIAHTITSCTDLFKRVAFLSPRRSFAASLHGTLTRQFGLEVQLYDGMDVDAIQASDAIIISMESIWKLGDCAPFDLVVMDESEACLEQMESLTNIHRKGNYGFLERMLRGARRVVFADAYVTDRTLNVVGELRRGAPTLYVKSIANACDQP